MPSDYYPGTRFTVAYTLPDKFKYKQIPPVNSLEKFEEALKEGNVSMALFETPSNPLFEIYDIEGMAKLCKKYNVLLAIDGSFCSPFF